MLNWTGGFNQILIATKNLPKKQYLFLFYFFIGKIFLSCIVVAKP